MANQKHQSKSCGANRLPMIILIVTLVALSACLLLYAHVKKEQTKAVQISSKQEHEEQQLSDREPGQQKNQDSFYQMLADGIDVNVLIVGDSIAEGAGASDVDHIWPNKLKANLESNYGVHVNLTNVSMGGNTSYAGYVRTMALDEGGNYDLVVLCYGQNDSEENFGLYYESIIYAVRLRYPKASIICIQESSQKDYTEKMQTIQSIADHYGLPVVDTIAPFQENYDSLVKDSVHPNDEGHQVYCETVMDTIKALVTDYHGHDPENVAAIDDRIEVFDSFQWFPANQFAREGNTFTLKTHIQGIMLGIDYNINPGTNSCKVMIDGVEYAATEVTFDAGFIQRRITLLNDWLEGITVNAENEIRVVFKEDEGGKNQADGFVGLAISGQK